MALVSALVLIVVIGVAAATSPFWHKSSGQPQTGATIHHHSKASASATTLTPISANGFDALNLSDTGNENADQAMNVLHHSPEGWSSQQYATAVLGSLKAGTGLIFDMGRSVRLSSVTVRFGPNAGADVQLLLGDSSLRSKENEESMTSVASETNVPGGSHTFAVTSKATGRYLVIWFTKMPPASSGFMAQVFSISVRGTAVSG